MAAFFGQFPANFRFSGALRVRCHMSPVTCHMSLFSFLFLLLDKLVKLVGGGSGINEAYPV